jgi:FemAB-related protein (PEP-CTERM system-associated)
VSGELYGRATSPADDQGGAGVSVSLSDDVDAWDRFVDAAPASTFSHLAGWRDIMTDVLGHECVYLTVKDDDGALRGVLPLVRVIGMLGHYLVSLPFLNDGGPLGDEVACRRLTEHAVAEARRSGARLLELRARHEVGGPVASSFRKTAVHLPLPDSVQALWEHTFRAKLRSQIRRPVKAGMTARVGADQIGAFYDVFARNMRDLGTPVLPRAFFDRLAAVFGDRVLWVAVYSATGAPAAAACCLTWRDEIEVTWASSLREYNSLSPNMLLYATLMEQAIGRGMRVFNFGRCTPGGATHRFKQQWGGRDLPLPWAFWSRDGAVGTPSADSAAFRLATTAWRRLPMGIANRLGPVLARQLP